MIANVASASQLTLGLDGVNHQDQTARKETKCESRKKQTVTGRELRSLLEKQGYLCALTGRQLTPDIATCDHIIPISKGGSNTIDNIQIVHKDANDAKRVMMQDEFIRLCKDVARLHP